MKLAFIDSKFRFFFALVGSPTILTAVLASKILDAQKPTLDPGVPLCYWYAAFAMLPLLVAATGAVLALELSLLSTWQKRLAKPKYATILAVLWNFVFPYLSVFLIAMGFWDCTPATYKTLESFNQTFHQLVVAFPHIVGTSLSFCLIPTAVVVFCNELMQETKKKSAVLN